MPLYTPKAISRSLSAMASLAVNLSRVLSVLSLAATVAPSNADLIATMSSVKENEVLDLDRRK
jgi:hypothetical protein